MRGCSYQIGIEGGDNQTMLMKLMIGLTKRQFLIFYLFISIVLIGCTAPNTLNKTSSPAASAVTPVCPVTEPVWVKPPEDAAIPNNPEPGYYYVNEDNSIWASAWWAEVKNEKYLRAGEEGIKVGWFRPAGEMLEISGERVDDETVTLEAHIPCCYPTRFQATGLKFPTGGCWEIRAKADESELSFLVKVES